MPYQMNIIKALYHGRGPSWKDVGIDTAGVFLGILIILAIVSIYIALKKDNEQKEKIRHYVFRKNKLEKGKIKE